MDGGKSAMEEYVRTELRRAEQELEAHMWAWLSEHICSPYTAVVHYLVGSESWQQREYLITAKIGKNDSSMRIFVKSDLSGFGLAAVLADGRLDYLATFDSLSDAVNAM